MAVAEHLAARGAEAGPVDENGSQPLHFAAEKGHSTSPQRKGMGMCWVWRIAVYIWMIGVSVHRGVTKQLLDAGADVNATDNDGWSGLHWSARNGHE